VWESYHVEGIPIKDWERYIINNPSKEINRYVYMFLIKVCCNKHEYYFGHTPFSSRWAASKLMARLKNFKLKKK